MKYDTDNVFAKILRGEIPCRKVYEDAFALAFHDLHPDAPVHVLVIPKGAYIDYRDFAARAGSAETAGFFKAVGEVAKLMGVDDAFRLVTNNGGKAGQVVFHFHVHLLAGKPMGKLSGN